MVHAITYWCLISAHRYPLALTGTWLVRAQVVRETVSHEVVANVLVGAEEAEAKLEALLQRKRELLGEA